MKATKGKCIFPVCSSNAELLRITKPLRLPPYLWAAGPWSLSPEGTPSDLCFAGQRRNHPHPQFLSGLRRASSLSLMHQP